MYCATGSSTATDHKTEIRPVRLVYATLQIDASSMLIFTSHDDDIGHHVLSSWEAHARIINGMNLPPSGFRSRSALSPAWILVFDYYSFFILFFILFSHYLWKGPSWWNRLRRLALHSCLQSTVFRFRPFGRSSRGTEFWLFFFAFAAKNRLAPRCNNRHFCALWTSTMRREWETRKCYHGVSGGRWLGIGSQLER